MRKILVAGALLLAACNNEPAPTERAERHGSSDTSTSTIAESCVEVYSPDVLAERSFAFDGTITAIDRRADPKAPKDEGLIPLVTFDVHRWYAGGEGKTVEVWIPGLSVISSAETFEAEEGARLLVAGEPRWGGEPLDDPIAWTCGFTQQWSEEAAAEWEAATS